jgi:hypothetical protein
MRTCSKCKVEKPVEEFYLRTRGINGRTFRESACKDCCRNAVKNTTNIELKSERERRYRLKKDFNISIEQYDNMLFKQNGRCAICKNKETVLDQKGRVRRLAVDHDSETEKVRGLLCYNCNILLGKAKDSIDILNSAITYLINGGSRCFR